MKVLLNSFITLGHREDDAEDLKLKKSTLLGTSALFAVAGVFWGLSYFFSKLWIPGSIPLLYTCLSGISTFHFARSANYPVFRASQLFLILILPFALQISLGGFVPGSAVIIWALMAPLGALVYCGKRGAIVWFLAFVCLLIIALLINNRLPLYIDWNLEQRFIRNFFVLNILGTSAIIFCIQYFFINQQRFLLRLFKQKHQWIKEAFASYLSPNLVQFLIQNPEALKLGGEKRECTFIFTDLVGFTQLVENSAPEAVITCVNEYIAGMTKIIFKHEGTIQKIMGDAIAVMFSAPVVQEDHAIRAVNCAMEMNQYAKRFALQKQRKGVPFGNTRIGVNTGTVVVGNFGSKDQLDYRAFGDPINTTARLESVNKYFGTHICISGSTLAQSPKVLVRPIGSLLLKGKSAPVATFEPITGDQQNTTKLDSYKKAFKLMEGNNPKAALAFENLGRKYPTDPLIDYHLKRLQTGQQGSLIVLPAK